MTRNRRLMYLVAAFISASPQIAGATTVTRTTTQAISFSQSTSATFSFADITNADELISISNGGVSSAEGGNILTIDVDYSNSTSSRILSSPFSSGQYGLSSFSNLSFTPGTINGLTFGGSAYIFFFGSIPTGTAFTFHTPDTTEVPPPGPTDGIPEPGIWSMIITGFGAVGSLMRTRRRRALFSQT